MYNAVMPAKQDRLDAIRELIESNTVSSQRALLKALRRRGLRVTQSTLSRDLVELGIVKRAGRYVVQDAPAQDPQAIDYSKVVLDIVPCGPHLAVVKTVVGQAQPVAVRIDEADDAAIVATLAGDDVVFVATRNRQGQVVALRRLHSWFGE